MFGVCYYPEHWPEDHWDKDAKAMAELGLTYVRIGEFAWSRLEPKCGQLEFDWFDRCIDTLSKHGLKVVIGTPTATPPKWLVKKYPDVLAVDPETGLPRGFGSRRHYDFSSPSYRREALRITEVLAKRYGTHRAVAGWQTDNELCCHDTTLSGSVAATQAFRLWCEKRYTSIENLNQAWGNVFWSMEYQSFDEVDLPLSTVTEANPAHRLAYHRFSSDQVCDFHRAQVDCLRQNTNNQFITHNFIPMWDTNVDDFALARGLDFPSYDNYPLGRTDVLFSGSESKEFEKYMRTGHPDLAAYNFDQTRGLVNDTFWVMEQQPGPVNWASSNPRPLPGMIQFWTLEALAHGATCVSYFRWRQAPFAQEQMHAGLFRPDNSKTETYTEVNEIIPIVHTLKIASSKKGLARVAILTDVEASWITHIERQSQFYSFEQVEFDYYRALRSLGLNIDFISKNHDFSQYQLVVAPCLPVVDKALIERIQQSNALFVFGPRSGSKTQEFSIPNNLSPGDLQTLGAPRILSVETLRPDCTETLYQNGVASPHVSHTWREQLETRDGAVLAHYANGEAAVIQSNNLIYLGTLTNFEFLCEIMERACAEAQVPTIKTEHSDLRLQYRGEYLFAFNYSEKALPMPGEPVGTLVYGQNPVAGRGVSIWQQNA